MGISLSVTLNVEKFRPNWKPICTNRSSMYGLFCACCAHNGAHSAENTVHNPITMYLKFFKFQFSNFKSQLFFHITISAIIEIIVAA